MASGEIDPVDGILAVLAEGATTGTNKYALLLALLDLAPPSARTGDCTSVRSPSGCLKFTGTMHVISPDPRRFFVK